MIQRGENSPMKRAFQIVGVVFLVVIVPGGLVALYEMHRAEREERTRKELREAQETQQALRDENKSLTLRLNEAHKARQALLEDNKNLKLRLDKEEMRRLRSEFEQTLEKYRNSEKK